MQIVGQTSSFSTSHRMLKLQWGKEGEFSICPASTNVFVIKMENTKARDRIVEGGLWYVHGQLLIVRSWEPGMSSLQSLKSIRIWVQLSNVPLKMFNQRGLGYIASKIGVPLYMDKVTMQKSRLAISRLCLEMKISKEISKMIALVLPNRVVFVQAFVPWLPMKCSKCRFFGIRVKIVLNKSQRRLKLGWLSLRIGKL